LNCVEECWNICEKALARTVEYFRKIPGYRKAGWRSIDVSKYLRGRVLDIGAGQAGYWRKNIPNDRLLILMDPAYDNNPQLGLKAGNLITVSGDGLNTPFIDKSVDVVISLAVLHHFPARECRLLFLREINRVLTDGGVLLLSVWFPVEKPRGSEVCDGVMVSSSFGERFYHFYSIPELRDEVEAAGFLIDKVEVVVENPRRPAETRNILLTAVKHKG
jgi:SAM-dependent methyltransferase